MLLHHHYRRRRRGERGASLTMVLLLATLSILVVNTLANTAVVMVRLANRSQNRAVALTLAEAGIDHAVDQIRQNRSYTGGTVTMYENPPTNTRVLGTFTTTVTAVDSKNKQIRSVGTMPNGTTREVAAWVSNIPVHDLFNYALVAKSYISLSQTTIGSYPQSGVGHIHSNGTALNAVDASANGTVDGRGTAVGGFNRPERYTFTKGYAATQPAVTFPPVDGAALKAEAAAKGTQVGDVNINGGTWTLRGVIEGNVSISGSPMVYLDGIVYVTGTLTVSGDTTINFSGGSFVCQNKINLTGNGKFYGTSGFAFISLLGPATNYAIDIQGNTGIWGAVYAPYGTVNVFGDVDILGTIAAERILLKGQAMRIFRYTDFDPSEAIGGKMQVNRWQEL